MDEAAKREAGCEAMVSELSEEIERKMFKEMSVERAQRRRATEDRRVGPPGRFDCQVRRRSGWAMLWVMLVLAWRVKTHTPTSHQQ